MDREALGSTSSSARPASRKACRAVERLAFHLCICSRPGTRGRCPRRFASAKAAIWSSEAQPVLKGGRLVLGLSSR